MRLLSFSIFIATLIRSIYTFHRWWKCHKFFLYINNDKEMFRFRNKFLIKRYFHYKEDEKKFVMIQDYARIANSKGFESVFSWWWSSPFIFSLWYFMHIYNINPCFSILYTSFYWLVLPRRSDFIQLTWYYRWFIKQLFTFPLTITFSLKVSLPASLK